jgi:hypothetical protein
MNRITASIGLVVAVAGCGGGGGMDMGSKTPDMGTGMETCMTDNMPVALSAHYGVKATLNVNIKVPSDCTDACIFDGDSKSSLLLLADMTQNGNNAMVSVTPCQIKIPPVALKGQPMPVTLTAPDALVQSVKAVMSTATLSGSNTCSGFSSMPIAIVIGSKLGMPQSDALPKFDMAANPPVKLCGGMATTRCDAAVDTGCICDQEGDGKLGATVTASGVPVLTDVDQVYLALRTVVALDGKVFPPSAGQATPGQRIKGNVAGLKLEQSPVGCRHNDMMGNTMDCTPGDVNSIAGFNPLVTQSTNNASTFVAMPVSAAETCAQLVTDAPTLFQNQ